MEAAADLFTSDSTRKTIRFLLNSAKTKSDFQRAQCLWLRAEFKMSAAEVSRITNLKPGTVRKIWSTFRRQGKEGIICKKKGGRRNSYMTTDEEKLFLSPFFKKMDREGSLIVADLQRAYEKRIGHKVPKSTIYRLLKRHGWKKNPTRAVIDSETWLQKNPEMHDYWIEGCSQAILPRRTGNISQQWLNSTLNSLTTPDE